jgi:hypothetical protein
MGQHESPAAKHRALYWGLAIGIAVPALLLGPELIRRLLWWKRGGAGEGAVWGEPLFHVMVLAAPPAVLGATAGAIVDARQATRQPPSSRE